MHALPQVYGGVRVGEYCLSCIAGGVNCSNYYVWLINFVQNREGNCATFWGVVVANFATTTADGELEQESNLHILQKYSSDHLISYANKKGHSIEWPYIHDGGDEGDRTPDLLTASQALSQLSYAPVTRRYYRGRSSGMQEVFWIDSHTYGFSWDGAELTDFDFGKISQLTHRPDKTLTRRCLTCRGRRSRRLGGLGSWPFS